MSQPAVTTPARKRPPAEESIKETLESVVMAFVLAFVFRAYVVEAFVIPTGSMAPTLLGQHISVTCTQCGYDFSFDVPDKDRALGAGRGAPRETPYITTSPGIEAVCPMCQHENFLVQGTRLSAGDRILVHKYIYSVGEPRRWDVVVFKNPAEPDTNFIKRLVGLPREDLWVIEGNIYTKPRARKLPSTGEGDWQIARKTARPQVQRAVWQPIYHSRYIPRPNGERYADWRCPWRVIEGEGWRIDHRRSYRHDASTSGTIAFDFERHYSEGAPLYPYNQAHPHPDIDPVEDIRLAANVEAQGDELAVRMSTTARLDDPDAEPQVLIGAIEADGAATLTAIDPQTKQQRELARGQVTPITSQRTRRVELWFVDQHAMLWVDGQVATQWSFELGIDALVDRAPARTVPRVTISVQGAATLHHVDLDRDLYYTSTQAGGNGNTQGTLVKHRSTLGRDEPLAFKDGELVLTETGFEVWLDAEDRRQLRLGRAPEGHPREGQIVTLPDHEPVTLSSGRLQVRPDGMPLTLYRNQIVDARSLRPLNSNYSWRRDLFTMRSGRPIRLGPNRFFCLGDNSPRSSDSRYWSSVNPWIRRRMLSDTGEEQIGVVPRKLMMGRAFFVYFPAMHGWDRKKMAVIPNFGDMRFIH